MSTSTFMTHLGTPEISNGKGVSCEANIESDIFASILGILRDVENQIDVEVNSQESTTILGNVEFIYFGSDDEAEMQEDQSLSEITLAKKDLSLTELERLVEVSELRLNEYLKVLNESDDGATSVATGKGGTRLIVSISPSPMHVDDSHPEASTATPSTNTDNQKTEKQDMES